MIELYVPRGDPGLVGREAERARRAAAALTAAGTPVRLVRSIYVPADELCLFLCEAVSLDAVLQAARHAGLVVDYVAETAMGPGHQDHIEDTN
jgi:hypothetical protein